MISSSSILLLLLRRWSIITIFLQLLIVINVSKQQHNAIVVMAFSFQHHHVHTPVVYHHNILLNQYQQYTTSKSRIQHRRRSSSSINRSTIGSLSLLRTTARTFFLLKISNDDDNDDDSNNMINNQNNNKNNTKNNNNNNNILNRFISPIIHDPNLPLSDVLIAMIIGPSIQLFVIYTLHNPLPSWLSSNTIQGGTLLIPTIIHGSQLAVCWLLGALASRSYERKSISPKLIISSSNNNNNDNKEYIQVTNDINTEYITSLSNYYDTTTEYIQVTDDMETKYTIKIDDIKRNKKKIIIGWDYNNVILSIIKSGLFAIGILILFTQLDIFLEYNFQIIQFGDSDEINFRLSLAIIEITNDIIYEALILFIWRLLIAYETQRQFPLS